MATHAPTPVDQDHDKVESPRGHEPARPTSRRHSTAGKKNGFVRPAITLVVVAAVAGGLYAYFGKEKSLHALEYVKEQVLGPKQKGNAPPTELKPPPPFTGLVKVDKEKRETIGFKIVPVENQTQPIKLELNGTTDYDLNTLTLIRSRFDNAQVERVYVSAGDLVKKGDPLLELRSADLAAAKNDCRTKFVQWDHDHKYLEAREPLHKEGRITEIVWVDTQNDEKKSRLDYLIARDKLAFYGMADEQVDKLVEGLTDDRNKALKAVGDSKDISKMTVLSPVDGVVVDRTVVPGNYYDMANTLLTISPMTELWVWGNVFESDQEKIHKDQKWDILFPYLNTKLEASVESIATRVDPDTRTIRIRASIPNPDKSLTSGMQVRALLKIPPKKAYDLHLVSWGDGSGVPNSATNLVVVGVDDRNVLHVRIFDAIGKKVADADESKMPAEKSEAIAALKRQLPGLLSPHLPTPEEAKRVVGEAAAIVGVVPPKGDTVIPRNALAVINGEYFVFVEKGEAGPDADLFERRKLEIDQENTDLVIVKNGLEAGERVVSNGALILAQMYEDQSTVESGMPVK